MYNENDLKTIFYASKGGMKIHQLAQLMSVSENQVTTMLAAAKEQFGGSRREKEQIQKYRRPYFRHQVIPELNNQPFTRPAAKYYNKSPEDKINEYLSLEI